MPNMSSKKMGAGAQVECTQRIRAILAHSGPKRSVDERLEASPTALAEEYLCAQLCENFENKLYSLIHSLSLQSRQYDAEIDFP